MKITLEVTEKECVWNVEEDDITKIAETNNSLATSMCISMLGLLEMSKLYISQHTRFNSRKDKNNGT